MLSISLRSMQLSKSEEKAREKLIKLLETEFNFRLVDETKLNETYYEETIRLYQIYTPKKSNIRGAGRKKEGKTDLICAYALTNTNMSISEIAEHFGCSRQYVSRVLKENKVIEEYKAKRRLI